MANTCIWNIAHVTTPAAQCIRLLRRPAPSGGNSKKKSEILPEKVIFSCWPKRIKWWDSLTAAHLGAATEWQCLLWWSWTESGRLVCHVVVEVGREYSREESASESEEPTGEPRPIFVRGRNLEEGENHIKVHLSVRQLQSGNDWMLQNCASARC